MTARSEALYLDDYANRKAALPGGKFPWVANLREAGIARFDALGFATPKHEEWKYTNLKPLVRTDFGAASSTVSDVTQDSVAPHFLADAHCLVFVDGHLRPDLSRLDQIPAGVRAGDLAKLLETEPNLLEPHLGRVAQLDGQAPLALNTALMNGGAVVSVHGQIAEPIQLLFFTTAQDRPVATHLRNLLIAAPGSSATVLETHVSAGGGIYWTNAATEVSCAANSSLSHFKLQVESVDAFHLALTSVHLAAGARYQNFAMSHGARLSRNEIRVALTGEDGECRLNGVFLGRGRQHLDTTTVIDHQHVGSRSDQFYKGVLDDGAHGVFQGKIIVRPGAQRTNAHQLNKNLLLTPTAQMDSKPELEIHADDVKCGHGAAVGDLDAEGLFYLRARGLDETSARQMMIAAFIDELIADVTPDSARNHFSGSAAKFLDGDSLVAGQ